MLSQEQERSIQGVGVAGFRKDHQHLLFVVFRDAASGQQLLAALKNRIASYLEVAAFNRAYSEILQRSGREDAIEATWMGLLIGPHGYEKLGVNLASELTTGSGSEAFAAGMAARAEKIGHTRTGDVPSGWIPAFQPQNRIDACVVVASDDRDDLNQTVTDLTDVIASSNCELAWAESSAVLPGKLKGHEHFGFKDGISQPTIAEVEPPPAPNEPPAVPIGEFVLGYPDEKGEVQVGSLWRDGSFVAFERIVQHVIAFRQQAAKAVEGTNPALPTPQMEAKMVGRWPSGTPVETAPEGDPGETGVPNAFQYKAAPFNDDEGGKAPRFAHIRKANPRDETTPDPTDPVARHRMIRRGVPFGPPLPEGATTDDGVTRGLHFLCFVADLARQFEFVQREWLSNPNFPNGGKPAQEGGQYQPPAEGTPPDGPDPVVGEHDPGAQCALHQASEVRTFDLGEEVVNVTAGEYFFAPSITALEHLASGATASQ
jgi:Dyp-type peroxidase family